jgi:DNA-binding NtrC family response regulator
MIRCPACECIQEPSPKCRRCGKPLHREIQHWPVQVVQPKPMLQEWPLMTIAEAERRTVIAAVERCGTKDALKVLGIGKTALWKKMKRYGLPTRSAKRTGPAQK